MTYKVVLFFLISFGCLSPLICIEDLQLAAKLNFLGLQTLNKPITIRIISDINSQEISQDVITLSKELLKLGHRVENEKGSKVDNLPIVDINLHMGSPNSTYFPLATKNYLIPATENYVVDLSLIPKFDLILCPSLQAENLFKLLNPHTLFLSFTNANEEANLFKDHITKIFNVSKFSPSIPTDKTVLIAILAKDKSHVLPTYLKCIENQEYDKKLITIYIRTNNNKDNSKEILKEWMHKNISQYKQIIMDDRDLESIAETNPHAWTPLRWQRLAMIRNESLDKTLECSCAYYFVVDCDNFISPCTLKTLISKNKPIIAPMLHSLTSTSDVYSNFFYSIDSHGYYRHQYAYELIFCREVKGTFSVPVVHHAYLIQAENIAKLNYIDGTSQWEFIAFSRHARDKGVEQYICNEEDFGTFLHISDTTSLEKEKELFENLLEKYERLDSYKEIVNMNAK